MNGFEKNFHALVVGANGGIGTAICDQLSEMENCISVVKLDRGVYPEFDLRDEQSIAKVTDGFRAKGMLFDLVFDATGALEIEGERPEKSIRELDPLTMAAHFSINAIGPALLIKHLSQIQPRSGRTIFATLGARVGSIEDNQLGGWISYRAAKAAQNQIIKTAAIELSRKNPSSICVSLHPGTVDTKLTRKYATSYRKLSPSEAAEKLLRVLGELSPEESGFQYDYEGVKLPS